MALRFNTAGPCVPGKHYMLSPERLFASVVGLIDEEKYLVVHAGRQTGKTTNSRWWVKNFNSSKRYSAIWVDVETAREQPNAAVAMRTLLGALERAIRRDLPEILALPDMERLLQDPFSCVQQYLTELCQKSERPVVVFFDEADGLVGETMVSFLTQLRAGYLDRSEVPFPHSVVLLGVRSVRDYALHVENRQTVAWLGTSSPFNNAAESATLEPFTRAQVTELLLQHTAATNQVFKPDAIERVWYYSCGQPWLVNALASEAVDRDVTCRTESIREAHIDTGKERIIAERRTHVDSLVARLREPRVQRVIAPMLVGGRTLQDVLDDDIDYVRSLGLLTISDGQLTVANPIYREVIPRALAYVQQLQIAPPTISWQRQDDTLDMPALMRAWQGFWRTDGHLAAEGFGYREAGPHLMLMAFLQRLINGGGRITREYGLGRRALDLLIEWRGERYVVEVKLRRDEDTEREGLEQLGTYLDGLGLREGWLVVFDLRKTVSWQDRLTLRDVQIDGRLIHVIGC